VVPKKLLFSGRAPSYQALAICILKNDLYLTKLGLSAPKNKNASKLIDELKKMQDNKKQLNLF
jgi:predicted phosphoadenosine phosphosulfate sulfurtransferase